MSGGSFNYIAERLRRGELGTVNEYRRLAQYLSEAGHLDAAVYTLAIATHLREARRLAVMLAGVHHAVEWAVSGDSGPEAVAAECVVFRETTDAIMLMDEEDE